MSLRFQVNALIYRMLLHDLHYYARLRRIAESDPLARIGAVVLAACLCVGNHTFLARALRNYEARGSRPTSWPKRVVQCTSGKKIRSFAIIAQLLASFPHEIKLVRRETWCAEAAKLCA